MQMCPHVHAREFKKKKGHSSPPKWTGISIFERSLLSPRSVSTGSSRQGFFHDRGYTFRKGFP
jgi:hypothetical protein